MIGSVSAIAAVVALAYLDLQPAANPNLLSVSGNIKVTDVEVGFKHSGWVEARPASEGQFIIQAGDPVARPDNTELREELRVRHAEVAACQAELAALTGADDCAGRAR